MSNVDTTDRAVERHESQGNPHADSAATSDLYTDTEARAATDGLIDADTVDGQHASDLGTHIEAKETAGSNSEESVSWSQSFSTAPVVTSTVLDTSVTFGSMVMVTSRSTTGASVHSVADDGNNTSRTKLVHAMEAN